MKRYHSLENLPRSIRTFRALFSNSLSYPSAIIIVVLTTTNNVKSKMVKLFIVLTLAILAAVDSAPQLSDVELKEQAFNRVNEAEYDYK